jgi:4-amino-4-deoxy-L-arabinose transferase-like glycosyltransferase
VFKLFGPSLLAVRIGQAVLGTVTVACTYVLARRVTSERGARASAIAVAVYPALLLYTVYLMAETLFMCLAVLGLVLWSRERPWSALAAGAVIGLATLTRSTGFAALFGVVLADAIRLVLRRHTGAFAIVARALVLLLGFALVLAPWIQRNYAIYGRIIPTDTSSGFNALLGNYEGATGRHPGLAAVDAAAQRYWRNTRNDVERSDVGMRVAGEFVRARPTTALALAFRKIGYFYGIEGREHAWGYSFHLQGRRESQVVWAWGVALMASFPLVMVLACVGLLRPGLSYSATGLALAATLVGATLIHVASFGDSRFHLPWIPLLAILAARAVAAQTHAPWTTGRKVVLAALIMLLALTWIDQVNELMAVLPRLAASPTPLQLPY